jgi:hypothetical protein
MEDNGILGAVRGEFIAAASKQLPPAEVCTFSTMHAEVDAADQGRVRIRFVRMRMKHGRSSHWAWVAEHAAKV